MIGGETPYLLGRHVADRAQDRAGVRVGSVLRQGLDVGPGPFLARSPELRDSEVENLDQAILGEEQVLGLQVAVHDALLVGGGEAPCDLDGELHRLARAQRAAGHAVAEGLALQQLRDDIGRAVVLPEIVDGDDVGVVEDAYGFGLVLEAADPVFVDRDLGVEDLEGHVAGEPLVFGAVDLAHASPAEDGHHFVGAHARAGPQTGRVHAAAPVSVLWDHGGRALSLVFIGNCKSGKALRRRRRRALPLDSSRELGPRTHWPNRRRTTFPAGIAIPEGFAKDIDTGA